MDRIEAGLPLLTPDELADPQTRIMINGFRVRLWQVAHLYGVNHGSPGVTPRPGASATYFRRLCPRQRDREIASPNSPTEAAIGPDDEGLPTNTIPNSPTLPRSDFASCEVQPSEADRRNEGYLDTRALLPLVDEAVDRIYSVEIEEGREPVATGSPLGAIPNARQAPSHFPLSHSTPFCPPRVVWADPSFPPPPFSPPNRPLPPLPRPRPASSRPPRQTHDQPRLTMLSGTTLAESSRSSQLVREVDMESERTVTPTGLRQVSSPMRQGQEVAVSRETADNWPLASEPSMLSEDGHDVDAESGQSVAPTISPSPRPPCMAPPAQEALSMPSASTTGNQPVPINAHGKVASALPRVSPGADGYRHREPLASLTEPWPELPQSVLQQPLPSFLQHPPDFLQHDPYEGPPPGLGPGQSLLSNRTRSSSTLTARESRPATPAAEDETVSKSRWSPDSSPELSRMKKVKKALSFARLRPRKSKALLPQTGSDANEPTAAEGLRASEPSASYSSTKRPASDEPPLTSAGPAASSTANGGRREGMRRKKSLYV